MEETKEVMLKLSYDINIDNLRLNIKNLINGTEQSKALDKEQQKYIREKKALKDLVKAQSPTKYTKKLDLKQIKILAEQYRDEEEDEERQKYEQRQK